MNNITELTVKEYDNSVCPTLYKVSFNKHKVKH